MHTYLSMHLCAQQLVEWESFGEGFAACGSCRPSLTRRFLLRETDGVYNIN